LREAAQAFVDKLAEIQPAIDDMCLMEQIHGRQYSGPTYGEELKALNEALKGEGK